MDARLVIGVASSVGIGAEHGGRALNEDNYLVAMRGRCWMREAGGEIVERAVDGHGVLLSVADGMGGHDRGEVASAAAVESLVRLWQRGRPQDPERVLLHWVPVAHQRLRAELGAGGKINLGTTLTVAWIVGDRMGWLQIGDSRLYRMRAGALTRLTRDQTHGEFASRDRREPGANASWPAQTFIYGSRGLGQDDRVRLDPGLDSGTLTLALGDRLLLCSDGVSGFLSDEQIARVVAGAADPQEAADDLVDLAAEAGSDDNLTAVVGHVRSLPIGDCDDPDTEADGRVDWGA